MIKEVLALIGWGGWQATSLVIFMVFMILVTIWAYRPQAKETYQALGRRALDDDNLTAKD